MKSFEKHLRLGQAAAFGFGAAAAVPANPKSKIQNPKSRSAFTLFEVLVAIAIFMLLAGGIFAAVQASMTASAQVVNTQLDSERLDAFQQFLRKLFVSLPSDTKVELKLRQVSAGDVVEVRIWPVPAFLQFGANSGDGAALSAQPDGRGGFRMMLGYFRAKDTADEREEHLQKASWLLLLPEIKQLKWRFAPTRNPVFEDTWNEQSDRPGIAELALTMKDGAEYTFQDWVPQLQRRSSNAPENATTPQGGMPKPDGTAPPADNEDAAQ